MFYIFYNFIIFFFHPHIFNPDPGCIITNTSYYHCMHFEQIIMEIIFWIVEFSSDIKIINVIKSISISNEKIFYIINFFLCRMMALPMLACHINNIFGNDNSRIKSSGRL